MRWNAILIGSCWPKNKS